MDAETLAYHIFRVYEDCELTGIVAILLKDRDERIRQLQDTLASIKSILWMAERYAEGSGSRGDEVKAILEQVKVES